MAGKLSAKQQKHGGKERFERLFRWRVWAMAVLFWLAQIAVLSRMGRLQWQEHARWEQVAQGRHHKALTVPAVRGRLLDRHGRLLAESVASHSIGIDLRMQRKHLADPRPAARALAKALGMPLKTVYARMIQSGGFVWLKRQVDPRVQAAVAKLKIPGVVMQPTTRRLYPQKEVGAHVVGFTDIDGRGLEGAERALQLSLAGQGQEVAVARDGLGRSALNAPIVASQSRGRDMQLALDWVIQDASQQALIRSLEKTQAKAGMAVVIEVGTGEILALATVPSFNPNRAGQEPAAHRRNRALTDAMEPGSVIKPLVVAAALELGVLSVNTPIPTGDGRWLVGNSHWVRDPKPYGTMTLADVLAKSSNVGAAMVGTQVGPARLYAFYQDLGLGVRTGLGLPGETGGRMRKPKHWGPVETATIAYGHGVSVSVLQLAAAYQAVANDGVWLAPRLFADDQKHPKDMWPAAKPSRRVMSRAVATAVRGMMTGVVAQGGTGFRAAVEGYTVGGKTGTAQKYDAKLGHYRNDRHVAWFAGMAPAERPRVVVVVAVDEPKEPYSGGQVAAPVFAEITTEVMGRLGVPAQKRQQKPQGIKRVAKKSAKPQKLERTPKQPVERGTLPRFVGMTARQAMQRASDWPHTQALLLEGMGWVVHQDPPPGTPMARIDRVRLRLATQGP